MNNKVAILARSIKIFYIFLMPSIVIIYLLIISSNLERSNFGNSVLLDFMVRLYITTMFCAGYVMLSDMNKYETWFYGNKWSDYLNENIFAKKMDLVMSIIFGIVAAIITYWVIQEFLPIYNSNSILLSSINGILFFIPRIYNKTRGNFNG